MINEDVSFQLNTGTTKPFLTLDQQLDLLESRGLIINNRENALSILSRTNYYRLSAYSLTKRLNNTFLDNVNFDDIYELYCFDESLRNIIMKNSEIIEIALRSRIAYEHSKLYGPLGYMQDSNFENPYYHQRFIEKLSDDIVKSDDVFVKHYKEDCDSVFPLWTAIECITFGTLSKLFKNLKKEDKTIIAKQYYGVSRDYIENWFQVTVIARNIAAHGGRFYGRYLRSVSVLLPKKIKAVVNRNSFFAYIYAIHHLLPTFDYASSMRQDIKDLLAQYNIVDIKQLGFPENWEQILEDNINTKASN